MLWALPGTVSLVAFAMLLTLVDTPAAGRAYAAYGGVYVAASLGWIWAGRGAAPGPLGPAGRDTLPGRGDGDPSRAALRAIARVAGRGSGVPQMMRFISTASSVMSW